MPDSGPTGLWTLDGPWARLGGWWVHLADLPRYTLWAVEDGYRMRPPPPGRCLAVGIR